MLNRSSSLSDIPTTKRIQIEELTSDGKLVVFKHFSQQEILSGDKLQIQGIGREISISQDKHTQCKSWTVKYERPVDTESNEAEENKPKKSKKHASSEKKIRSLCMKQSPSQGKQTRKRVVFVILPFVVALLALYLVSFTTCEMPLNVLELKLALVRSVYGQTDAINEIESELSEFSNVDGPEMKLLAFVGGVGVGKSYVANLIASNFQWQSNVQDFILPVQRNSLSAKDVCYRFSTCGYNLVVVDGLNPSDATHIADFLKNLAKCSESKVIVLLVFGLKDHKDDIQGVQEHIHRSLEDQVVKVRVIAFQPLQEEEVEMCVQETLFKKGVPWTRAVVQKVLSLLPSHTGCKGVASKVQIVIQEEKMV